MAGTFRDEHAQLRTALDAFIAMIDDPTGPDIAELLRCRLAISGAVRSLLASQQSWLEPLRTGNPSHVVDRLLDEHTALLRDILPGYNLLVREWTPARIERDWQGYRQAVRAQIDAYRAFLNWEVVNLLPLIERGPAAAAVTPRSAAA